jgi:hypothetical protein
MAWCCVVVCCVVLCCAVCRASMRCCITAQPVTAAQRSAAQRNALQRCASHCLTPAVVLWWWWCVAGAFNLQSAVMEAVQGFRRAGAKIIITYFADLILDALNHAHKQSLAPAIKSNL